MSPTSARASGYRTLVGLVKERGNSAPDFNSSHSTDDGGEISGDEDEDLHVCPEYSEGAELPSQGSAGHGNGTCRRCCFFPKGRCNNGFDCNFCHFAHEKRKPKNKKKKHNKRRQRQKTMMTAAAAVAVPAEVIAMAPVPIAAPIATAGIE